MTLVLLKAINICMPLKPIGTGGLDLTEHGEMAYHSPVRQYIQEPKKASDDDSVV